VSTFFVLESTPEMANGRPLFAGTSETDQLDRIFRSLGTPDETVYAQIAELPEYKSDFAVYPRPDSLASLVPTMDELGCNLMQKMIHFDPAKRVTAQDAMQDQYFDDLSDAIKNLGDHK